MALNLMALTFAAYNLRASQNLEPRLDLHGAAAANVGQYVYFVAFGRGAIALLCLCLTITSAPLLLRRR